MKLFSNQQTVIRMADNTNDLALFHEPGLGKTLSILEIFKQRRISRPDLRLLVVCPISLIEAAWGEDIKKFTKFSYIFYENLGKKLPDILIINYEKLIRKNHFDKIKKLITEYDFMCAVDESSRMKNHKSATTKALLLIEHLFRGKFVMSGSPMPNSILELWSQISFICPGLLPHSFFQFRNKYFQLERSDINVKELYLKVFRLVHGGMELKEIMGLIKNAYSLKATIRHFYNTSSQTDIPLQKISLTKFTLQELQQKGFKYMPKAGAYKEIMNIIQPYTHWVKKAEALDLPNTMDEYRHVYLSGLERKAYEEMKKYFITEIGDKEIVASVALTKMMKLRQCASGFFYDEDKEIVEIGKSSKLAELNNVLDELGEQQIIIWIEFRKEANDIIKLLEKRGASYQTLTGQTKDKELSINQFKNNEVQYLVAHPQSAAHGLTFINCCTAIFYSYSFSYEQQYQARERIYRIGQKKKCLYIYLVSQNTLDPYILKVINGKRDLQDVIYEYVKEAKK